MSPTQQEGMQGGPDRGFNMAGWRASGRFRLRTTFFGFVRVQELIEYSDGRAERRKPRFRGEIEFLPVRDA